MLKTQRITILITAMICMAVMLCACNRPKEYRLAGLTMGTTYSVLFVVDNKNITPEDVAAAIKRELDGVNKSMSVFDPQSEVSRFNAFSAVESQTAPFIASTAFYDIMQQAQTLYAQTGGAWDGTIMPLVDLWGFGPNPPQTYPPQTQAITAALNRTGFNKIVLGPNYALYKQADVSVDLSSIAKGYGVDRVAEALNALGIKSFLVEIGGEIYAKGVKPNGEKWRVGISNPNKQAGMEDVYAVTELNDRALATSGNYRNFLSADGAVYAHIIDPRSGYPVKNTVASVSVIAPTCARADGLATAMYVMGPEKSLELVANDSDIEVFIIEQLADGSYRNHMSPGMGRYLK